MIYIVLFILLIPLLIPLIIAFYPRYKSINGFVYSRYPFNRYSFGSLANPETPKRGYTWTSVFALKKLFSKTVKNIVYIDNFRFDSEFVSKSHMNGMIKKWAENMKFYFDPLKMTQGILLIGKMGAGKTEWFFNILSQKFYNRAIIHQIKAGDFSEKLLRKSDILFSPYDKRGYLWDVLSEDIGIIQTFFVNIAAAEQGDKKDFFTAASQRIFQNLAIQIKTKYQDETPAAKWMMLIKVIKDTFAEMDSGTQKSKQDVKSTMEIIFDSLEEQAWMMQNPHQKSFIIKEFFERKNQCRLILDNIPEHEKKLTPLFSAFTACVSQIHTSLPDSKTDFTLYALDEYLSFVQIMDDASKKRLHTLIRSKGGILIAAIQYIPKDDKKLQQLLTSSAYSWICFSIIEEETINLLKNSIGETEYSYEEKNSSYNHNAERSNSYSTKNEKIHLIYNELLNGLGDKYEHIVYLPNHKALYKGYTPQQHLKPIAKKSVPVDLTEFYKLKYIKEDDVKEDVKNLTFADLFKQKPLSKLDEYRLFKKFEKANVAAKQSGSEEPIKNFKKENNLIEVNLEFLFQKFIADKQIVDNKMKLLSPDERFKLKTEWDALEDEAKQLEFIERNDLFGALPNIFDFTPDESQKIEDDFDFDAV